MTEPQDPQNPPPYPGQQPPQYGAPTYEPGAQPGYGPGTQPAYGPGFQGDPSVRPGSVTAAAWISIVLSVLSAAGSLTIFAFTQRMIDYVREHPEDFDTQGSDIPADGDLKAAAAAVAAILVIAAILAIAMAIATLKRQGWARIVLVAMSVVTALVSLFFSLFLVGVPWLAGSITVIVLLLSSRANAWFRGSGAQQR